MGFFGIWPHLPPTCSHLAWDPPTYVGTWSPNLLFCLSICFKYSSQSPSPNCLPFPIISGFCFYLCSHSFFSRCPQPLPSSPCSCPWLKRLPYPRMKLRKQFTLPEYQKGKNTNHFNQGSFGSVQKTTEPCRGKLKNTSINGMISLVNGLEALILLRWQYSPN